jgi:ribose 5-phosphate isomerase A
MRWRDSDGGYESVLPQLASSDTRGALMIDRDALKREAALAAVEMVQDGMVVGLGTGSTAKFVINELIDRVSKGLRIVGIPTSEHSARQAREGGIKLTDFAHHPRVDVTIDGADEIERRTLHLVKGLGGALLREKIVATASDRVVIVADESKLVNHLGETTPVPVEVVNFGWETTLARIAAMGGYEVVPRRGADGQLFRTDSGNMILDCGFGQITDPRALNDSLKGTVGVVETGLFIGIANIALVATVDGVVRLERGG